MTNNEWVTQSLFRSQMKKLGFSESVDDDTLRQMIWKFVLGIIYGVAKLPNEEERNDPEWFQFCITPLAELVELGKEIMSPEWIPDNSWKWWV